MRPLCQPGTSRRRVYDMICCQQQCSLPADLLVMGAAAGNKSCPRHPRAFQKKVQQHHTYLEILEHASECTALCSAPQMPLRASMLQLIQQPIEFCRCLHLC